MYFQHGKQIPTLYAVSNSTLFSFRNNAIENTVLKKAKCWYAKLSQWDKAFDSRGLLIVVTSLSYVMVYSVIKTKINYERIPLPNNW